MIPLPTAVKRKFAGQPYYLQYYYGKTAIRTYYQWLFKSYRSRYQADKAALWSGYKDYESLFAASPDNFEAVVAPYTAEFTWFVGRVCNNWFGPIEAELYYSIIRKFRPNLIIEIGSGHSTSFAMDALRENHHGRIISIDPQPRRSLPPQVEYIQSKVEDVDASIFDKLGENDILFIDSSHTTEEAQYHCDHILPRLRPGVIIHHHDVAYPYDIYFCGDAEKFGEPDVLLKFYQEHRDTFEIFVGAAYVRHKDPELLRRLVKSHRWNPDRVPTSLWARRK